MKEKTQGGLSIFLAYILWGVLPVYWKFLLAVDSTEILAHRAIWSCVFSFVLVAAWRKTRDIAALFRSDRRTLALLFLSSVIMTANWGLYIWAVNDGRIVECSLGYFILPLVSMLFGAVIFKERVGKVRWLAIGIAAAGVCAEVAALGHLPFVSLGLAATFGLYGLLKKFTAVESLVGLTVETLFMTPFALAWLLWLQSSGAADFPYDARTALLLAGTGAITSVPLIMFAWGVRRSAMTTVGLIQYTSPILMFLAGTLIYHEPVSRVRLLSFVLTWISITIFTANSFWNANAPKTKNQ